jgi:hypothetical protein
MEWMEFYGLLAGATIFCSFGQHLVIQLNDTRTEQFLFLLSTIHEFSMKSLPDTI